MEKKTRLIFILTFLFSSAAAAFLVASMATDYWIESFPVRLVDNNTLDGAINVTEGEPGTKFKGYIHYGLLYGEKKLDSGLGIRVEQINVAEDVVEDEKYSFGLWVSTLVFVAVGIALGVTNMAMSALNASIRPVQTILGPIGLYVWSVCGVAATLTSLIIYLILFFEDMKINIMTDEELEQRWTSEDRTNLYYSFYFLVIAIVFFSANIITVALSNVNFKPIHYAADMNGKSVDGLMMY